MSTITESEMRQLVEQIKEEPSVLFLGQKYLESYENSNPFYAAVKKKMLIKNPIERLEDLWNEIGKGADLTSADFSKMHEATALIPEQWWLRKIFSMRWGMIYTTAIDECFAHSVGPNLGITPIPMNNSQFRREYINKNTLNISCLYGTLNKVSGAYPPASCSSNVLRRQFHSIQRRVDWISTNIIQNYGVLVVDGWDKDTDWYKGLLSTLFSMPWGSVYLFGVTKELRNDDDFLALQEDGILAVAEENSFANILDEYGYFEDLFEFEASICESSEPVINGKTISLKAEKNRIITHNVPTFALESLDYHVTLFHDSLGVTGKIDPEEIRRSFAQFLQMPSTPNWILHNSQYGFYFNRSVDKKLMESVENQLKKKASKRQLLLLEGVSNSGKTASLIHLAQTLRDKMICPVFYIHGTPTQNKFEENLKSFIKKHLQNKSAAGEGLSANIVIIWDGNADASLNQQSNHQRYSSLMKSLVECNVLVIGTVYKYVNTTGSHRKNAGNVEVIAIEAKLFDQEQVNMGKMLQKVDPEIHRQFADIRKRQNNPNLLYLLRQLSQYHYSPEWQNAKESIRNRFKYEVIWAESEAVNAVNRYNNLKYGMASEEEIQQAYVDVQDKEEKQRQLLSQKDGIDSFENVEQAILKTGAFAAWQLQLQAYLQKLQAESSQNADNSDDASAERKQTQLEELQRINQDIQMLNQILAIAGQFSISLPITLIFNTLKKENDILLSRENLFINKVLQADSLIEYSTDEAGFSYVRFRHPADAEEYIRTNFPADRNLRKGKEIELLKKLIRACNWYDDESYDMIRLIRCFGPNSGGKYSDNIDPGHYFEYLDYLIDIANCLIECADGHPEAVLTYAHFVREKFNKDVFANGRESASEKELSTASEKLYAALEEHDRHNIGQYNRLLVEKCANLLAKMPESHNSGKFDQNQFYQFCNSFRDALRTWENSENTFSTNALLDIWLNAVIKFFRSFKERDAAMRDPEFVSRLVDSINYIDQLLSIEDDLRSTHLMDNIYKIYELADINAIEPLRRRLEAQGNDTMLYLDARRFWLTNNTVRQSRGDFTELIKSNLFLLPDSEKLEISSKEFKGLKSNAKEPARKTIELLEQHRRILNDSPRCLYMLIRSKWLDWTGNMPLEEHQEPKLTTEQWHELGTLCRIYLTKNVNRRHESAVLLLRGIYLWTFGRPDLAREPFSQLRRQMNNNEWFIERIGLCDPQNGTIRKFNVNIEKNRSDSFTATISREIDCQTPTVLGRYGIHVSDYILSYLFEGQTPTNIYNIQKPVVIWFNGNGPTLGIKGENSHGD